MPPRCLVDPPTSILYPEMDVLWLHSCLYALKTRSLFNLPLFFLPQCGAKGIKPIASSCSTVTPPNLKMIHLTYRNVDVMKHPMGHSKTTSLNLVDQDFGNKSTRENCPSRVLLRKSLRLEDYQPWKGCDRMNVIEIFPSDSIISMTATPWFTST